jgi:hypothetical protein
MYDASDNDAGIQAQPELLHLFDRGQASAAAAGNGDDDHHDEQTCLASHAALLWTAQHETPIHHCT